MDSIVFARPALNEGNNRRLGSEQPRHVRFDVADEAVSAGQADPLPQALGRGSDEFTDEDEARHQDYDEPNPPVPLGPVIREQEHEPG